MENNKQDPFGGQMGGMVLPDRGIADAGAYSILNGLMMAGITLLATDLERNYQAKLQAEKLMELEKVHAYQIRIKELEALGRAQVQAQPQSVNPYRGANTVADLERILLLQPPSPQREGVLRDLARYPETMAIAQLPSNSSATKMLTGR